MVPGTLQTSSDIGCRTSLDELRQWLQTISKQGQGSVSESLRTNSGKGSRHPPGELNPWFQRVSRPALEVVLETCILFVRGCSGEPYGVVRRSKRCKSRESEGIRITLKELPCTVNGDSRSKLPRLAKTGSVIEGRPPSSRPLTERDS